MFLDSDPTRAINLPDLSEFGVDMTPLHYAAYAGHESVVSELIERRKGANINARNAHGFTPLFYSAQQGRVRICEMLMEKGADPLMAGCDEEEYPGALVCPLDQVGSSPQYSLLSNPKQNAYEYCAYMYTCIHTYIHTYIHA